MATQTTFTVKSKDHSGFVVDFNAPDSFDDPRWSEIVAGDTKAAIHELALQQFIVKCQGAARGKLSAGKAAVQAAATNYKYGARGGSSKPTIDAGELKLSAAQIAALEASGCVVVNKPEPTSPESGK
jgi:hypothetical protein